MENSGTPLFFFLLLAPCLAPLVSPAAPGSPFNACERMSPRERAMRGGGGPKPSPSPSCPSIGVVGTPLPAGGLPVGPGPAARPQAPGLPPAGAAAAAAAAADGGPLPHTGLPPGAGAEGAVADEGVGVVALAVLGPLSASARVGKYPCARVILANDRSTGTWDPGSGGKVVNGG